MKPMDAQTLLDADDLDLNSGALLLTVLAAHQIAEQGEQADLEAAFGHVWARCKDAEYVAALQAEVVSAAQPPDPWAHSHQWLDWLDRRVVLSRAEQRAAGLGLPALTTLLRSALEGVGSSLAGRPDAGAVWPALLERAAAAGCALPYSAPQCKVSELAAALGDPAQCRLLIEYWTAGLIGAQTAELLTSALRSNPAFLQCYRKEVLDTGPLCYAKTAIVGHQRLLRVWALPHLGTGSTTSLWATNQGLRLDVGDQVRAVVGLKSVVDMEDPVIGKWSIELQVDPPNWTLEVVGVAEAMQRQRAGHTWDASVCQAAASALDDVGLAAMVERLAQLQREAEELDDEKDTRALDVLQSVVSLRLALQAYLLTAPDTASLRGRVAAADRKLYEAGVVDALCLVPSDEAWWTDDPLAGTIRWIREAGEIKRAAEDEIDEATAPSVDQQPRHTRPHATLSNVRHAVERARRHGATRMHAFKRSVASMNDTLLPSDPHLWRGDDGSEAVLRQAEASGSWEVVVYSTEPLAGVWLFDAKADAFVQDPEYRDTGYRYTACIAAERIPASMESELAVMVAELTTGELRVLSLCEPADAQD